MPSVRRLYCCPRGLYGQSDPGAATAALTDLLSPSTGLRAERYCRIAAHWTKVPIALFETQVDELPLPGDKTDDGENQSHTAAMEVKNEDNESVQSKTAAPAPAEHEA